MKPENWLKDKRGNWSFTRISSFLALLVAVGMWVVGLFKPLLADYCKQGTEKLIDYAKWAFGAGKVMEELGPTNRTKEDV